MRSTCIKKLIMASTLASSVSLPALALDDEFYYLLGGGEPIGRPTTNRSETFELGAGIDWGSSLTCGNFDMSLSVKDQLNGVVGSFETLMSDVIDSATGVVASLPAMIIQKINPALYDLLQNGVLQASEEFQLGVKSCEAIVKDIEGGTIGDGWKGIAQSNFLREESQTSTNELLSVRSRMASEGADRGIEWVDGIKRGGLAQAPIELVTDTAEAGYNLLLNRAPSNSTSMVGSCDSAALCETWNSPGDLAQWLVTVLGERRIRTCEGCNPLETRAGMGLTRVLELEQEEIKVSLTTAVAASAYPDPAEIESISGGPALVIGRRVIDAIREERAMEQGAVIERLSGEMAVNRVMEHALMARRALLSGMKEPNIANVGLAQEHLQGVVAELDQEVSNLLFELDVRTRLANNTPGLLLKRVRIRNSVPLIEGTPGQRLEEGAIIE